MLQDPKGELDDYNWAIEYKPDFQTAYYERGTVKCQTGDKTGGCNDMNRAVQLGSDIAYKYMVEHCK